MLASALEMGSASSRCILNRFRSTCEATDDQIAGHKDDVEEMPPILTRARTNATNQTNKHTNNYIVNI